MIFHGDVADLNIVISKKIDHHAKDLKCHLPNQTHTLKSILL